MLKLLRRAEAVPPLPAPGALPGGCNRPVTRHVRLLCQASAERSGSQTTSGAQPNEKIIGAVSHLELSFCHSPQRSLHSRSFNLKGGLSASLRETACSLALRVAALSLPGRPGGDTATPPAVPMATAATSAPHSRSAGCSVCGADVSGLRSFHKVGSRGVEGAAGQPGRHCSSATARRFRTRGANRPRRSICSDCWLAASTAD